MFFHSYDATSEWGENFMKIHPICIFEELEAAFYKRYQEV
jgi:hypothetical protein